jgi:tetratricopeptide (TPR) repeat protein/tRNA A-37 threonylcarbamoyl transferase component Bud32
VHETKYEAEYAKPAEGTDRQNEPQDPKLPSGLPRGDWAPGQELLDDFVVERTLGEGGMGKVYLVRSRSTGSRFAVKRAKVLSESSRRRFLDELQTWIDLPEHPNLVPCRFFRTVGEEVLIFAEYVEGGSLEGWIDSRRLYEGGHQQALERMLDIAIQFAWGLHCLHELGLIHQDVKPGNVLISAERGTSLPEVTPRITDFGLARARAAGGEAKASDPRQSILVSTSGGTPSYWSPEQAAWLKLTRGADIWSWGVSVLELFTGGIVWNSGLDAPAALERLLRSGAQDHAIPAMPDHLADLLRLCFHQEPLKRLASLNEAVSQLKAIYQESTGAGYNRTLKGIELEVSPQAGIKERRSAGGAAWTDPRVWLEKALRAAGRGPAEAAAMLGQRGVTRRGELVAEMAVYDEAKRLYVRLVREGHKELECDLAELCMEKALVHETAADGRGAIQEYDQTIAIREQLVNQEGRRELAHDLAMVYMNKAIAVRALGDNRGAAALYDQAIAIREQLVNQEGRRELANDLAMAYMNKAVAMWALGDHRGAVALYDQAIAIREQLVNQEGRRELANDLALAYMNKAIAVEVLGDHRGAVALYDQAIAIWERLVNREGRHELTHDLAKAYMNKAIAVSALGDHRGAVALYDQVIAIWERLVNQEGRRELANNLAMAYMNKAIAVTGLGDNRGAVVLYDKAIAILERLVNQEGRRELANELAGAYMNKASAVSDLGDERGAVALYDQVIAIRERLVNQEGRRELTNGLAMVYFNKANAVSALGDNRGAVALYDQVIAIRERLVNQEGRRELANDLAMVYMNKALAASDLGDNRSAAALYDQAIAIWERLVNQEGRRDLANSLAMAYMNKAMTVRSALGDHRGAVALYDQAIAIRERLVNQEGRRELIGDLAWARAFRGNTLILLGERTRGLEEMRSAQRILETEIGRTGRADLKQVLRGLQQQLTKHSA